MMTPQRSHCWATAASDGRIFSSTAASAGRRSAGGRCPSAEGDFPVLRRESPSERSSPAGGGVPPREAEFPRGRRSFPPGGDVSFREETFPSERRNSLREAFPCG